MFVCPENYNHFKLEYEQKNGQLTDAAQARSDAFKAGKMVRDGLLALPDRLADLLAAESDPAIVRKTLLDELEAVLNKLGG